MNAPIPSRAPKTSHGRLPWFPATWRWLTLVLVVAMGGALRAETALSAPAALTTDGETQPLDLVNVAPRFAWQLPAGTQVRAFQIVLGTSPRLLTNSTDRIFESAWIESSEPHHEYTVADNTSPQRLSRLREPYYWTVRVRDAQGRESPWAPVAQFALRPPMPPRWGLGLVLSAWTKYATADDMRFHAEQARQTGVPADAVCIDLNWGDHLGLTGGWAPGYAKQPELEAWLRAHGFHFIIINHLGFSRDARDPVVAELFDRGFINLKSGVDVNLHNREDAMRFHKGGQRFAPDFANPAAREFIKQKILKPYIEAGIDAWWNDLPDDYGDWGATVTADADLYLKTMWDALAENTFGGNGRPFMISQPANRLYPAFSPGIPRGYWRGMLTHVVTQVRMSEHDMSGVIHAVTNMISPPNTEYFARSSAFGLMFPMAWNHNARFPWLWLEDLRPIYAKYARLHYRLIPFYYTAFHRNWEQGDPILRSMDAAFPGGNFPAEMIRVVCPYNRDILGSKRLAPELRGALQKYPDTIRVIDTQYLLGNDLLIVPVYPDPLPEEKVDRALYEAESKKPIAGIVTTRRFWLPPGRWANFWNAEILEGPRVVEVDCPIDMLPIYVRMGAIIPLQPDMNFVGEKPVDPLTFDVYPQGESRYALYEDDGLTRDYRHGIAAETELICRDTAERIAITLHSPRGPFAEKIAPRTCVLRVRAAKPAAVTVNGREHAWSYDAAAGKLVIEIPAPATRQMVEVKIAR